MQTYHVRLESAVSESFRCTRAANSLDIDSKKKSVHELTIRADIESDFSVGLIVGSSGSGKTTLAKKIFGDDCFKVNIDQKTPIIDQLPKDLDYEQCSNILSGIGLTSVPCWIRPVFTLSNGQKARAEAALAMLGTSDLPTCIDEWTSVVDRTVAKVMSHCVQKFARKSNKKIVLNSCHYDVIEWLDPDWIIDCNTQKFIDRRLLRPEHRERKEKLHFTIKPVDRSTWRSFSKYHYLSAKLAGGKAYYYGLFMGEDQIGFQAFSNYVPKRPNRKMIFHSNRVVIHPDYCGLGLGLEMTNKCSAHLKQRISCEVYAAFSSIPMHKARMKRPDLWRLLRVDRKIGQKQYSGDSDRAKQSRRKLGGGGFRSNVKMYSYKFIGK